MVLRRVHRTPYLLPCTILNKAAWRHFVTCLSQLCNPSTRQRKRIITFLCSFHWHGVHWEPIVTLCRWTANDSSTWRDEILGDSYMCVTWVGICMRWIFCHLLRPTWSFPFFHTVTDTHHFPCICRLKKPVWTYVLTMVFGLVCKPMAELFRLSVHLCLRAALTVSVWLSRLSATRLTQTALAWVWWSFDFDSW